MSAACVSKFPFFEAFLPNSTGDHFMRHPVQQIVYKCCKHLPKLNFRAEYNAWSLENTQPQWFPRCYK